MYVSWRRAVAEIAGQDGKLGFSRRIIIMETRRVVWTNYMRYRAGMRGFDLAAVENIVRYSTERYADLDTGRFVAIGRHASDLLVVAYEATDSELIPVTVHATSRSQVGMRVRSGRYRIE